MDITAAQTLTSYMTLGKVLLFFDSQLLHLQNENYDKLVLGIGKIRYDNGINVLHRPTCNMHLVNSSFKTLMFIIEIKLQHLDSPRVLK